MQILNAKNAVKNWLILSGIIKNNSDVGKKIVGYKINAKIIEST
jgi:hypothetical protein